ncbi:hypothetical protein [Actinoplanes sp. M2I2]|uniref:hypothetical protein n=1 Tax=Actinoplanes sp. M2I2 TaxID=1734444 RepID=UPI0020224006|nr:hypothetical protein [Actinoplanes sp. M2I2]
MVTMSDMRQTIPAPRWTVWTAWLVPILVVPSAVWRAATAFDYGTSPGEGAWYPLLLSALSLGLATLTLGLVHRWGERFPAWVPAVGGRSLPVRAVYRAAAIGALLLIALSAYFLLNQAFGFVKSGPVWIGENAPQRPVPGSDVMALYAPLLLWGPLLLAIATNYRRRVVNDG